MIITIEYAGKKVKIFRDKGEWTVLSKESLRAKYTKVYLGDSPLVDEDATFVISNIIELGITTERKTENRTW